ncbi:MAG: Hsp70 family protein, partial [Flavobacteriales bacterium]|nr:Hsp70 family protein [Flavobacteriales bacterium]
MGTDKRYAPAALDKDFSSEELSAEVLKKLKSFVQDENVHAAVVTVPAKFTVNQKDATARAAKLAGFDMFELLQEPIAACMAYGLGAENKDGTWVVFDFGGGTFDVALVRSEEGIMKVLDTEGDNHLGGKNLDYAIVDELIVPNLAETYDLDEVLADERKRGMLRDAMKHKAEEAKIQLSYKDDYHLLSQLGEFPLVDATGEEVELDLSLTSAQLEAAVAPIFQRAIDIAKSLLERNQLKGGDVSSLILVGGPTHSPILRQMLEEQIAKPDTRIDPMTAVAVGAALYASTIQVSEEVREATRDLAKVQLDLGYEATSVQPMEFVSVKLHENGQAPVGLMVELERMDGTWASGRKTLDAKGDVVEVELKEGRVNAFAVKVYDASGNHVACEPDQFTVIQGTQVSAATLPSNMGIEIYRREDDRRVFMLARGLEMNQSLPATGTLNGLRTSQDLRPGNGADVVRIPIYEGGHDAPGSLAILNEHIYDARITGSDVPSLVPAGSTVDVTIQTDRGSGRPVLMKVYFPHLDEEVEI